MIVSEEETGVWIAALPIDDNEEFLFVVCERSKSDVDDGSKRKFSKPGGGPIVCCLSIIDDDDDDEQAKSVNWFKNTSSNVLLDVSLFILSIEVFDVVCTNGGDGVTIDETNKAARSASVKLL